MTRCGCYLRVSTDRQTVECQRQDVERMVRARGFEPVWFEEVESAAKARPVLDQLLAAAHRGEVQAVAVWALDRLGRSMTGVLDLVLRLDRFGVPVMSVREPWLDTSGPVRPLLVSIFGWVAEQERTRLKERVRAGLERARRDGIALGRPRTRPAPVAVRRLREQGLSWPAVARKLGVSQATARRAVAP
jgi:DNA invertase Pin-like site-specific DNA recombinase